jgi:hypothetical protein
MGLKKKVETNPFLGRLSNELTIIFSLRRVSSGYLLLYAEALEWTLKQVGISVLTDNGKRQNRRGNELGRSESRSDGSNSISSRLIANGLSRRSDNRRIESSPILVMLSEKRSQKAQLNTSVTSVVTQSSKSNRRESKQMKVAKVTGFVREHVRDSLLSGWPSWVDVGGSLSAREGEEWLKKRRESKRNAMPVETVPVESFAY